MAERLIGRVITSLFRRKSVEAVPGAGELVELSISWEEVQMVREALKPRPSYPNDGKPFDFMGVSISPVRRSLNKGGGIDIDLQVKEGELILREAARKEANPQGTSYTQRTMANALGAKAMRGRKYKELSPKVRAYVAEFALGRPVPYFGERRRTYFWERLKKD